MIRKKMIKILTEKKNVIIYVFLNLFAFVLIYILSSQTALEGDDLRIQQFYGQNVLDNAQRALDYSIETYMTWHGRFWVCYVSTMLGLYNKTIYNIFNAFVYIFLINTIVIGYGNINEKHHIDIMSCWHYTFSFCMIWVFVPSVFDTLLWLSGSIGYLWTSLVILLCGLYWYRKAYHFQVDKCICIKPNIFRVAKSILLFAAGLLSGISSEPGACTLLLISFLCLVVNIKKKRVCMEDIFCFFGILIGVSLLIFAPGNGTRVNTVLQNVPSENAFFVWKYGVRIIREAYYSLIYLSVPIGIYFCLLLMNEEKDISIKRVLHDHYDSMVFVFLSLVSVLVMTFSAGFSTRIILFPLLLLIIASIREMCKMSQYTFRPLKSLILALFVFSLVSVAFCEKEFGTNGNKIERSMYTDFFYSSDEVGK